MKSPSPEPEEPSAIYDDPSILNIGSLPTPPGLNPLHNPISNLYAQATDLAALESQMENSSLGSNAIYQNANNLVKNSNGNGAVSELTWQQTNSILMKKWRSKHTNSPNVSNNF